MTALKNKARRVFRKAKRNGTWKEPTGKLAKKFFNLVHKQSSLKKKSRKAMHAKFAKMSKQLWHQNLRKFASNIRDDNKESRVDPVFLQEEATDYFNRCQSQA